ncbi:MAG: aminoacyl-tRNA hydrolase [Acidimicrobiales bacterium]
MSVFEAAAERRGTPADLVVLGLGNPGLDYARSRHNAGADCVAGLAAHHGERLSLSKKERAEVAEIRLAPTGSRLVVAVPTTYYNEAGMAAAALVKRYGIDDPSRFVVVHDEMDLPVGRIKVKVGGGLAGNNGLKSVKAHLQTDAFLRIRIGVGKPPGSQHGRDHVLRTPGKREREELDVAIADAADAIELIATDGVERAMERYNRKD